MTWKNLQAELSVEFQTLSNHERVDEAAGLVWFRENECLRHREYRARVSMDPVQRARRNARSAEWMRKKREQDQAYREREKALKAEYQRKRLASDPEFYARKLEHNRAYKARKRAAALTPREN